MAFEDIHTEGARDLAFVLSEAEAGRSRDQVTIAAGSGVLLPGTVLGATDTVGEYVPTSNAAEDGSAVASAVLAYGVDASGEAVPAVVIARAAQVKRPMLILADGATDTDMIASLAAVGIISR